MKFVIGLLVALVISVFAISPLVAAPPSSPVLASTAEVSVNNSSAVILLEDPGFWRLDIAAGSCSGGQIAPVFRNTSSQYEYVTVPQLQQSPFQVAPGGSYSVGSISAGSGFGAIGIQAADGLSTIYETNQGLGYQCRVTGTIARAPQIVDLHGDESVSTVAVLPYQANQPITVLRTTEWRIDLGTMTTGASCQVFNGDPDPGAPFVFHNVSNNKIFNVQNTSIPPGGSLNLGTAWPTSGNPMGALAITSGGMTTTAYLTGGFIDGSECWGTANLSLVSG